MGSLFLGGGADVLVANKYIPGIENIILIGPSPKTPKKLIFTK
jgi:hypothetical protein